MEDPANNNLIPDLLNFLELRRTQYQSVKNNSESKGKDYWIILYDVLSNSDFIKYFKQCCIECDHFLNLKFFILNYMFILKLTDECNGVRYLTFVYSNTWGPYWIIVYSNTWSPYWLTNGIKITPVPNSSKVLNGHFPCFYFILTLYYSNS